MKQLILTMVFVGLLTANAQTNSPLAGPAFKNILVTNWYNSGPMMRVFNDRLYDVSKSPTWRLLSEWEGLGSKHLGANGTFERKIMSVNSVRGDTVTIDILRQESWPERYSGMEHDSGSDYLYTVVVLHAPHPETITTGGGLICKCVKTKNYSMPDGKSLRAYDCGVQYTNLIPYVRWVKVRADMHNTNAALRPPQ